MAVPWRLFALGILAGAAAAPLAAVAADDVKITAGRIEDTRSSGNFGGGLSVELKLDGGLAADVKALRVKLKSAKDDTGGSLLPPAEGGTPAFDEFSVDRRPGPNLKLKNPARGAAALDVKGDVELFVPKRDPATTQRFERFLAKMDKPIASSALKSAKVEIVPLTAAEYAKRAAKNKPSREEIVAEGKKHGASDKEIEQALKLVEMMSALGGDAPDETSVVFAVKDPDERMLGLDLVAADGTPIHCVMRSSSGGKEGKLTKLGFSEKPPADATLAVTLRTAKSVVTVPLDWKGVALP